MNLFVQTEDFKKMNVGFALDEGMSLKVHYSHNLTILDKKNLIEILYLSPMCKYPVG